MKTRFLFIFLICFVTSRAQVPLKTSNNAFAITRMAAKMHVAPRQVDDSFSVFVFRHVIQSLDGGRYIFTQKEYDQLKGFQYSLDEEILNKKQTFLSLLTSLYITGLQRTDSMFAHLSTSPVDFFKNEKFTDQEYTNYPTDGKTQQEKLRKVIKSGMLDELLEDVDLPENEAAGLNSYVKKAEPALRKKIIEDERSDLKSIEEGKGGIPQAVADEYCKAIALCYDPHTEYFPLTEKENFETEVGQVKMVFGFNFKQDDDGLVRINNLAAGGPAFKSGQINNGDRILSIKWAEEKTIDLSNASIKKIHSVLDISNHDKASFKIKKLDGSEREVVLYKAKLETNEDENKVKSFILKGTKTVGFISLPAFYQDWDENNAGTKGCANDVAKEILKLKSEKIQGLIIDFRYNGGGSMQEAIELSGIFIDAGPVGLQKARDEKVYTLKDYNRGTIYDGPLMIMVNGYTASAAEMVAGTLQDYHRAVIAGTPTYGKATAQVIFPLDTTINLESDFSRSKAEDYLKLTISQLYRVTGNTAQFTGVIPDIFFPEIQEVHPQREKDNEHALPPVNIEAAKYFQPLPQKNIASAGKEATREIAVSSVFNKLDAYNKRVMAARLATDIDLQLTPAMVALQKDNDNEEASKQPEGAQKIFTAETDSFTRQRESVNAYLKGFDTQWIDYLNKDPFIKIAYSALITLIP